MGFKDDVRTMGADLERRVSALEALASQLQRSGGVPAARTEVTRDVTGTAVRPATNVTPATGVDYGAVAFGLSEIKRKVAAAGVGSALQSEYRGAVQYFADVFAKSDPNFNADEFRRQAGA